jgi:hypothetical protein
MASGTIVIMHLRGSKAVARVRKMLGGTDPSTAEPGSLRGTFGIDKTNNFMVAPPGPPPCCFTQNVPTCMPRCRQPFPCARVHLWAIMLGDRRAPHLAAQEATHASTALRN